MSAEEHTLEPGLLDVTQVELSAGDLTIETELAPGELAVDAASQIRDIDLVLYYNRAKL